MKKPVVMLLCLFASNSILFSQKDVAKDKSLWIATINNVKIGKKTGIWAEAQFRTHDDFVKELHQLEIITGFTYYVKNDFRLTAGYVFLDNFPGDNHAGTYVPEHRAWEQMQWFYRYPHVNIMQWLRFEQRFVRKIADPETLGEGYNYSNRVRFMTYVRIPLNSSKMEPKTWFASMNDEVFLNFGKNIVYNIFDHNRAFAGIGYVITKDLNFDVGYMNLFQQKPAGNKFVCNHVLRLYVFYTPHFEKKKKEIQTK